MQINWTGYQYRTYDGYGRYGQHMIRALERAGVSVTPAIHEQTQAAAWLRARWGLDLSRLTVACMPPFALQPLPADAAGELWLLTMTEGSDLPEGWAEMIHDARVARVIVPCAHNADVFRRGGVTVPVCVVPGGTDPEEFPFTSKGRKPGEPYTFAALADRGARKGWVEVWDAFYQAFGTPVDTPDVRLIIKARPDGNELLERVLEAQRNAPQPDPRIDIRLDDLPSLRNLFAEADCFVIPSRSEGWGMPHREAAMMGRPVITQAYAGVDDGHTDAWAIVVPGGRRERINLPLDSNVAGEWLRAHVGQVAAAMRRAYLEPEAAAIQGARGAVWLRQHQTWDHAAARLIELFKETGVWR